MIKEQLGTWKLIDTLGVKGCLNPGEAEALRDHLGFLWEIPMQPSWDEVRGMFDLDEMEPLNAANLSPTPIGVVRFTNRWRIEANRDASMQRRTERYKQTIQMTRGYLAAQLNAAASDLALVRNTTEANNILAGGWKKGGEILLWRENHETNNEAWRLKQGGRATVRTFGLPEPPSRLTADAIVQAIIDAIRPETRLISFSEVSNLTGIRIPVKPVIAAIRARFGTSIHVHVDGAQTWGSRDVDLKAIGCDSFSASAHKWFMGPLQTGILYIKKERATDFDVSYYGYAGDISIPGWQKLPADAARFELLGQRDDVNLCALLAAAEFHDQVKGSDPKRIEARVAELAGYLIEKLAANKYVHFVTPKDASVRHGVVVFNLLDGSGVVRPPKDIYEHLHQQRFAVGYHDEVRDGVLYQGVRICPHVMTSHEKIDGVVNAINALG